MQYLNWTILARDDFNNTRSIDHFRIAITILNNANNPRLVALLLTQISAKFRRLEILVFIKD